MKNCKPPDVWCPSQQQEDGRSTEILCPWRWSPLTQSIKTQPWREGVSLGEIGSALGKGGRIETLHGGIISFYSHAEEEACCEGCLDTPRSFHGQRKELPEWRVGSFHLSWWGSVSYLHTKHLEMTEKLGTVVATCHSITGEVEAGGL